MTYEETVQYLYDSTPVFEHVGASAYKEGLQNTLTMDEHFGHPHRQYQTIHIAGTNGKGSCSHTLAAILQAKGLKVGLYTSPHLVDFRERIRVNGKTISKEEVVKFVEVERPFFEPLHPSFFELTTALAFKYFAEQEVDVAVIEVGLGGRLDCTNIITPVLSVITNISFDHTQFLGDTLAKIAEEKAGIIKEGVPVVIGETTPETRLVFLQKAAEKNAPVYFAEGNREVISSKTDAGGGRDYQTRSFGILHGELGGLYQEKNTNTILCILKHLGINDISSIRKGFDKVSELTGLTGRWQMLQRTPKVVCDTGHNVGGWQYLAPQIKAQACKTLRIVFGMVDDKDIDTVMSLLPKEAVYYWTQASSKRAIPAKRVAENAKRHGLHGKSYPSVMKAYGKALSESGLDDFIFVGGSSYIVADLLTYI
ncbi:folylpolyglutamate synthase/dihydrofolate synthase family protein [Prevotella sp. KH2C16]|uniref:bifunctional folylpolyglutamate synthase/dihydrofolate synthase n=1 Tax=Prevotella sp. KH2C16 TaxID=1855325 RepID=UPI0008EDFB4E|nr:folylpolyglutamate synthase/dihydrofolate synthase family protein [Prevotella sp. KH2C16]SFF90998.1 dihydrofolate synthase / folylpolyglutamate synthase [Prevotella sp. KH2C16]